MIPVLKNKQCMKYSIALLSLAVILVSSSCNSYTQLHSSQQSDTLRIEHHLTQITKTPKSRNYLNISTLNSVADYIYNELEKVCDSVYFQNFMVNENIYKNVIASIGPKDAERIIIGAHYDVAGNQEGADDNASGIVGMFELARMLSEDTLKYRIDFVAYTLEEPPFFRTKQMGSYIHAKYIHDNNIPLKGMVCLEMIGYFNDTPGSQSFPLKALKVVYGNTGNFITVVQKYGNGAFGREFNALMKNQKLLPTKSFKGPQKLPGIDFSDHQNYWKFQYSAVMITNTAFYRNHNYHQTGDKLETLNLTKMSAVINEVYHSILQLK